MHPPQRIVTNFPKAQIAQSIADLEQSIEADRLEIGIYQILAQRLSATSLTAVGEETAPIGVGFALRGKDQAKTILQGLVQREYEEINGKQEVVSFLQRLMVYAT